MPAVSRGVILQGTPRACVSRLSVTPSGAPFAFGAISSGTRDAFVDPAVEFHRKGKRAAAIAVLAVLLFGFPMAWLRAAIRRARRGAAADGENTMARPSATEANPTNGPAHTRTDTRPNEPQESERDRIARRAYERFLARGSEHGRDQEDWFAAEQEIREQGGSESIAGDVDARRLQESAVDIGGRGRETPADRRARRR